MNILIVDDSQDFCSALSDIAQSAGYESKMFYAPEAALKYLESQSATVSLILLDIEFGLSSSMSGIDVLEISKRLYPAIPVIMISGKGTIETAVKSTKLGAMNFIEKGAISSEKIIEAIKSAVDRHNYDKDKIEIFMLMESFGLIGRSNAMLEVGDSIVRYGRTDLNVLITGETGTGKRLAAQAIHHVSRRAKSQFVVVDIPNIPRELFQSELFGHLKGSFSGAVDTKRGLFHQANKGTLFLDEIGDLTLDLQSNLLLPIEEKRVRKVGAIESEDVDVRVVSATDKDLIGAIQESKYREQLYHRLRECEITMPALRDRVEDIPAIINFYLAKHNREFSDVKSISPAAIDYLSERQWKGNVRELASAVKVVLQTTPRETIEVVDIHKTLGDLKHEIIPMPQFDGLLSRSAALKEDLAKLDHIKIEATLDECKGNVSKAAALLGVSRETLHNKIRRYGIEIRNFRKSK